MKRLNETPWKPTGRTENGCHGIFRLAPGFKGVYVEYHDSGFVYPDEESAKRKAEELNAAYEKESAT